jgi:hypothetical protein
MRIVSKHPQDEHKDDAYFTVPEAVAALLRVEGAHIPRCLWEPFAGGGGIVNPLRAAGHIVIASDLRDYSALPDYQCADCTIGVDALTAPVPAGVEGIVTNTPYGNSFPVKFVQKAVTEVDYVALLLSAHFLESAERFWLFERLPFTVMWSSSDRLNGMHRLGWDGPVASDNRWFAWFIWDRRTTMKWRVGVFSHKIITSGDLVGAPGYWGGRVE